MYFLSRNYVISEFLIHRNYKEVITDSSSHLINCTPFLQTLCILIAEGYSNPFKTPSLWRYNLDLSHPPCSVMAKLINVQYSFLYISVHADTSIKNYYWMLIELLNNYRTLINLIMTHAVWSDIYSNHSLYD